MRRPSRSSGASARRVPYARKKRETAGGRAHLAAQERYERLCSAAEMETRKLTLSAKQKVLAETYDRALEILCSMPREEYLSLLVRLLKAAGGKGDEKIALSAKDRDEMGETLVERANKELNAHYTLAGEAADIRAGRAREPRLRCELLV